MLVQYHARHPCTSSWHTFMMICLFGTIMVTPRKSAFRFSGSSCGRSRGLGHGRGVSGLRLCKCRHATSLPAGVARVHGDEEAHARVEGDCGSVCEHEAALALPDGAQHAVNLHGEQCSLSLAQKHIACMSRKRAGIQRHCGPSCHACCAQTDSTSRLMRLHSTPYIVSPTLPRTPDDSRRESHAAGPRLNSSKQPQRPDCARPL